MNSEQLVQLAVKECNNNGNKYRNWYYGNNGYGIEWCAVFVSWCLDKVGIKGIKTDGAGCFAREYSSRGKWLESEYTEKSTVPQAGDIVTFCWNGKGKYSNQDKYYSDHVGIVTDVTSTTIYTVEGNTGSSADYSIVSMREYPRTSGKINGYFRLNELQEVLPMELQKGDKNIAVYFLKQCLRTLKDHGIITQSVDNNNIFGVGTENAVKQVQKISKIDTDGIVGTDTEKAISKLMANLKSDYKQGYNKAINDVINIVKTKL